MIAAGLTFAACGAAALWLVLYTELRRVPEDWREEFALNAGTVSIVAIFIGSFVALIGVWK